MAFLPSKTPFKLKPPPNPRNSEQTGISLLASSTSLSHLLQTLSFLLKTGLDSNIRILTKLSSLPNALPFAFALLPNLPHYDSFLFNSLIRAHHNSPSSSPISTFILMLRVSVQPNNFTFPFLLKSCSSLPNPLPVIVQIHSSIFKFGFQSDPYVRNTLIHSYSSCELGVESARKVFDEMCSTSTVTWSALISGLVKSGRSDEALCLFREMQVEGVQPDEVTLLTVLGACADLGALELVRWIGCFIERGNVAKTVALDNALIDALAKCGDVDGAVVVFRRMRDRTIVSWTSVIDGLATHGQGKEALEVFDEMKSSGIAPDSVALIGVLTACSHAGLVDEGRMHFDSMRREFGIVPKIEHYGCMVDLLARAGLVEEALELVERMPIGPNPVIWRTLIGACKVHGKLDLGERIVKDLIDKEPTHSSNYVLLSNVYALTQRWEKKMEIRKTMSKRGIQKEPGCTLLELDGEIFEFVAGDESHLNYLEIYEMVGEIEREIKKVGYVAMKSEILLDVDEEDKEGTLRWHSEKLAIAFALLRTARWSQIRIKKNLRVCGDCHSATKLISKVYGREILVRDRSRFHRFKDGECSCKDFW